MDKLTKVLVDSKMKSLQKRGSCKNGDRGPDPVDLFEMVTNRNRDIEEEKRRRLEKHQKEERKREEMRNKYRQKYGLDKDKKKGVIRERNCYVLDGDSGRAIAVHKRLETSPKAARRMTVETSSPGRPTKPPVVKNRPNSAIGFALPIPRIFQIEDSDVFKHSKDLEKSNKSHSVGSDRNAAARASMRRKTPIGATDPRQRHLSESNIISNKTDLEFTNNVPDLVIRESTTGIPSSNINSVTNFEPRSDIDTQPRYQPVTADASNEVSNVTSTVNQGDNRENENTENSSWENNVIFRYLFAPLLNRKSKSLSDISSLSLNSKSEELKRKEIPIVIDTSLEDLTSPIMPNDYNHVFIDDHGRSVSCSLDSRKGLPSNGRGQTRSDSLYPVSRKNSFNSVRSSATALSDPLTQLPRHRKDTLDGLSAADFIAETPPVTRSRKRGVGYFLKNLRRSKDNMKCLEVASRTPVHGDHSLLRRQEAVEDATVSCRTSGSSETSEKGIVPRDQTRRHSTDAERSEDNVDSKPTLACSSEAAKRAEYIYYKYMSQLRKP